ncbi:MAG TPA: hypothetical protein VKU41_25780 [Polyangiaceae bacterium]|nr:hypothetical protein [Polyangiaceae bacterium]
MPLRAVVDGVALAAPEADALWQRFSAWMEAHPSDLGGFARSEGFATVHPEFQGAHGREPTLVLSRTGAQRPYESAVKRGSASAGQGKRRRRSRGGR